MDVDSNAPTRAGVASRETPPASETGGIDGQAILDDPEIALAIRIAVSVNVF